MPFSQAGDNASTSFGAYNDVAGIQFNTYNQFATQSGSRLQEIRNTLKLLDPVDMNATHREECLPGTRADVTDFILEWVQIAGAMRSQNVLVIRGLAGSGKSTLATTIANSMNQMRRLGAFVFFERDVAIRSDPSTVIRTLAYKLGLSHPAVGNAIAAIVEQYPEITHFPLRSQFEHLLIQPMTSEGLIDPALPAVFVLDALDECGGPDTRAALLELLAEKSSDLPALFVITTRALQDINGAFEGCDHILVHELDITTKENNDDISTFLAQNLQRIRQKYPSLRRRSHWPGVKELLQLTSKASGLFIWASTACRFIDNHPADSRLEVILQGTSASIAEHALDALYRTALEAAGSWDNPEFVSDFRAILGFILVARRPLDRDGIVALLGNTVTHSCIDVISQLGCVLQLNPKARLLHPSFADFLRDLQRCYTPYWLFEDLLLHRSLALRCIQHLDSVLKENLYDMALSPNWVSVEVPDDIAYACMYWIDHICMASESATVVPLLEHFIHGHLLHWIEAMSILKASRNTISLLEKLYVWLNFQDNIPDTLLNLVNDGVRFVLRHADLIENHPLLVYSSALPFTPPDTVLYKTFHDPLLHPVLTGTEEKSWSPLLQVLSGHKDPVNSVAFSPCGTQILSGSYDKTVRVWDAASGTEVLPAMRGHKGQVTSVAFSPDGTRILSGSYDHTVRLWDASSGLEILPPMLEHTDFVKSVAFSHDGQLIISGSDDTTVRIWDATTGAQVQHPLKGHSKGVASVSCSQTRIASGSDDTTVRVWDIGSGVETIPPLQGHTGGVTSVAFSPDGSLIASGSWDKTIHVWDATSGIRILPPLQGHLHIVESVAFSSDGTRIVSGSGDETIRVWDATTGYEAIPPLIYTQWINSVSFSPDGARIVSGSRDLIRDATVQVWDVASAAASVPFFEGQTRPIESVAFSPDGARLVSTSFGNTVRVWDVATRLEELLPMWHIDWVTKVRFSNDGRHIFSRDVCRRKYVWDALSGTLLSDEMHEDLIPPSGDIHFDEDSDWITDRLTRRYLSKLPFSVDHQSHASHGRTLVIGTDSGKLYYMQFPANT